MAKFLILCEGDTVPADDTEDFGHAVDLWAEIERNKVPAQVFQQIGDRALIDITAKACLNRLSYYRTYHNLDDAPAWLLDAMDRISDR